MIYGLLAGASYGLSTVPLKLAASRPEAPVSPHVLMLSSCLGTVLVSMGTGLFTSRDQTGIGALTANALMPALLSGIIGAIGCFMVTKALSVPSSSTATVMALVNTNVVFSLVFGMLLLGEVPSGLQMVKSVAGILLMTIGAVVLCL